MKRLNVLISAFACHPPLEAGAPEEEKHLASGESILGWNIVNQVARFHDAWVLTQARNRPGIERAQRRGEAAGVRFRYLDYKLWWKPLWHKSFTLHFYYYFWQWLAWAEARKLRRTVAFDLAQHATFANDWMPDYIGARLDIPSSGVRSAEGSATPRASSRNTAGKPGRGSATGSSPRSSAGA